MPSGRLKKTLDDLPQGWQDKMIDIGRDGGSEVKMRVMLGISNDLWYRLIEEEPAFSETVKRAKDLCAVWWEDTGKSGMFTGKDESFNATTWIFNMKNRFNWRDKQEVKQDGGLTIVMKKEAEASD